MGFSSSCIIRQSLSTEGIDGIKFIDGIEGTDGSKSTRGKSTEGIDGIKSIDGIESTDGSSTTRAKSSSMEESTRERSNSMEGTRCCAEKKISRSRACLPAWLMWLQLSSDRLQAAERSRVVCVSDTFILHLWSRVRLPVQLCSQ